MKTIEYTNTGITLADCYCEAEARLFLTCPTRDTMRVSNELFILAARALIHEGVVPHTEVRFLFDGQYIAPDKDGILPVWPQGFCDMSEKLLYRMLDIRKKRDANGPQD